MFLAAVITEIDTGDIETAVVSSFEDMVLNHVVSLVFPLKVLQEILCHFNTLRTGWHSVTRI